jgi:transcriptional regulator with XRE-family HTH domain
MVLGRAKLLCYVSNVYNEPYIKALGRRIIELRGAKGLSQETLANLADIPVNQVGRIERGEINTTVSTVYAIAKALKLNVPELFDFHFKERK